jgi:hypothetical protein
MADKLEDSGCLARDFDKGDGDAAVAKVALLGQDTKPEVIAVRANAVLPTFLPEQAAAKV